MRGQRVPHTSRCFQGINHEAINEINQTGKCGCQQHSREKKIKPDECGPSRITSPYLCFEIIHIKFICFNLRLDRVVGNQVTLWVFMLDEVPLVSAKLDHGAVLWFPKSVGFRRERYPV